MRHFTTNNPEGIEVEGYIARPSTYSRITYNDSFLRGQPEAKVSGTVLDLMIVGAKKGLEPELCRSREQSFRDKMGQNPLAFPKKER